jgi:HEAT repeat protein
MKCKGVGENTLSDLTDEAMMATPNPNTIAANLAVLTYLARHHPEAGEALAEAARVSHLALGGAPLVADSVGGRLEINGKRLSESGPGVRDVNEHLMIHSVRNLTVPATAGPEDLLAVARVLAAYPGAYLDWNALLEALGPARDRVEITSTGEDLPLVHYADEPDTALLESGAGPADDLDQDTALVLPPIAPEEWAPSALQPNPRQVAGAQEDAQQLQHLVHAGRSADQAGDMVALLDIARSFLDAADAARQESAAKVYRIELNRLLTRGHLTQFARLAALGQHRELAVNVLRRLGADATEVLMEMLVDADDLTQRRGLFTALTRMVQGTDIIAHHLDHPAWYVVRNAADLCGELRLERSVPALGKAASHPDERVRKSVVAALVKIGAREGLETLARLVKDPSPAIRLQVLGSLDAAFGRPLAMSLAALLETEEHPDVVREALKALGRIGSPDALQALRRAAGGGNPRLTRRQRSQAIESLGTAGAPAAVILRGLAQDSDREVAESATKVLAVLPQ